MSPYVLGEVVRAVMDKGGLTALAIMGGFFVLAYFIREGLSVVKAYSTSKENERAELIQFIKSTQAKQDNGNEYFISFCTKSTELLSRMATQIDNIKTSQENRHMEIISRFNVSEEKHEEILRDYWKSMRGGQ